MVLMDEPERISRLRAWWRSARSTYQEATWERRIWACVGLIGLFVKPLRESVPAVFFMSAYALSKGSSAEAKLAKREMLEEEAEETSPEG